MTKKADPATDPSSIGNILMTVAGITRDQLSVALTYQKAHDDIMLGEACIRLGLLDRQVLEAAILSQGAMRNGGAVAVADLATEHTRGVSEQIDGLCAASAKLVGRLEK